jgi:succinyl-diaminopimelate desuccinylase
MNLEAAVDAAIGQASEELFKLCAALVACPSVNPPGDTSRVASTVVEYLRGKGCAVRLVANNPSMPNVVSTIAGRRAGRHLVFNGHMDTMEPGDESAWSVPRFALTRREGRLYGLGMGNMKGAVAAMALAFTQLARHSDRWSGRLTFTAVSDECVFGDNGSAFLLMTEPDVVGDALICGEGPGWMRVALGEKGVAWYSVEATADGGHASRARVGSTGSVRLARALMALDCLNERRAAPPPGLEAVPRADEEAFRLSVNAGTLSGGSFISQIATTATAAIDVRLPPGISLRDFEALLNEAICDEFTRWNRLKGWDANWSSPEHPFIATFLAAAHDIRETPAVATVRLPASDASRWRALGVPAVCYGPQPTLSSGIDDYALEKDVLDCARIYAAAALRYLADHTE